MNCISNDDVGEWFDRKVRQDAVLFPDKRCLILKTAWWMNPWACIEGIPANATKVDVFVYHALLNNFSMANECNIKLAIQSTGKDLPDDKAANSLEWETVKTVIWPLSQQGRPRGKIFKQKITTIDIPRDGKYKDEVLNIYVEVIAKGGGSKHGWVLEAYSAEVTEPKMTRNRVIFHNDKLYANCGRAIINPSLRKMAYREALIRGDAQLSEYDLRIVNEPGAQMLITGFENELEEASQSLHQ